MKPLASAPRRRAAALALVAGVVGAHLWLAESLVEFSRLGEGAADSAPSRIEVAFVRELAPTAPPPPPLPQAAPPPAPRVAVAVAPAEAASSALPAEPAPPEPAPAPPAPPTPPPPEALAEAAPPVTAPPERSEPVAAPGPAPPVASTPAPVAFEWPPSTRLSYLLTGNFNGPVEGRARVEWLRNGARYQVHLDVRVGLDMAPLVSRRMSSDGALGEQGLKPSRYDEETRVLLRAPRRVSILFEGDRVILPAGRDPVPAPPGVQDTASQFVHLTWLFSTQPQRLKVGEKIELPLALPRRVDLWTYDVVSEELLETPAGRIPTFYVRPRREARAGGDLVVETWFAPSLQYLPVRIRIRQDADSFADLVLERLPQQEARPAAILPGDPNPPPRSTPP